MEKLKVKSLISAIRDSFIGADVVYRWGSCYQLYKILKTVFPEAQPYMRINPSHIATQIGNELYDIEGPISESDWQSKEDYVPIDRLDMSNIEGYNDREKYLNDLKFDMTMNQYICPECDSTMDFEKIRQQKDDISITVL